MIDDSVMSLRLVAIDGHNSDGQFSDITRLIAIKGLNSRAARLVSPRLTESETDPHKFLLTTVYITMVIIGTHN
jgi:hypothetical protein